jgi:hypothetical protein
MECKRRFQMRYYKPAGRSYTVTVLVGPGVTKTLTVWASSLGEATAYVREEAALEARYPGYTAR